MKVYASKVFFFPISQVNMFKASPLKSTNINYTGKKFGKRSCGLNELPNVHGY